MGWLGIRSNYFPSVRGFLPRRARLFYGARRMQAGGRKGREVGCPFWERGGAVPERPSVFPNLTDG
jgi:hypothetical protein